MVVAYAVQRWQTVLSFTLRRKKLTRANGTLSEPQWQKPVVAQLYVPR